MAVPAIELKPRGAIALFDAAIRLCARTSGVWALTLPGGAAVMWAGLALADAVARGEPRTLPVLAFTLAWLFRGVCQAAACHYLDELLLATEPPSTGRSFRAALRRLPSVIITAAYLPLFSALTLLFTLGASFFFLSNHLAGWAVTMKGRGHPLALYGTCSQMLGGARANATPVRALMAVFLLFGVNVHLAANALIYLGRKLVGLDLTCLQRFASMDNGAWVTVVVAVSFAAFEPLRAAVATLLLIDGRVRQEGLDLLSAVEQLPRRRAGRSELRSSASAAALVLLCAGLLAVPAEVRAQEASRPPPLQRIQNVAQQCEYAHPALDAPPDTASFGPAEEAALRRLADDVELFALTWEDCDSAAARLEQALPLLQETAVAGETDSAAAAERAQAILARPEFQSAPPPSDPRAPPEAAEEDPDSLWARFKKWWFELLKKLFEREATERAASGGMAGAGMSAANVIAALLVVAVVVLVGVLLYLAFRGRSRARQEVEVEAVNTAPVAHASESALSRPPEGWASLADELAAAGRFREAVRSLYLALLSRLHRAGAIDYDPALSNWDYCRQFRGRREWVPTFRDLTHRFDLAWYGQQEVGQDGYLAFRKLSEPLLSDAPQQGGGAPGA